MAPTLQPQPESWNCVAHAIFVLTMIGVLSIIASCTLFCQGYRLTRTKARPIIRKLTKFREVGVMSMVTYKRKWNTPRFQADNQGFWEAGQVDIGDQLTRITCTEDFD